ERLRFRLARLAVDAARLGLLVVDAPGLLGELRADIVAVALDVLAELAEEAHGLRQLLLLGRGGGGRGGVGWRGGAARAAGHCRRHQRLLDLLVAAGRAAQHASLALLVVGRAVAEPSLELMPGLAAQVVQDHASGPGYLKSLH